MVGAGHHKHVGPQVGPQRGVVRVVELGVEGNHAFFDGRADAGHRAAQVGVVDAHHHRIAGVQGVGVGVRNRGPDPKTAQIGDPCQGVAGLHRAAEVIVHPREHARLLAAHVGLPQLGGQLRNAALLQRHGVAQLAHVGRVRALLGVQLAGQAAGFQLRHGQVQLGLAHVFGRATADFQQLLLVAQGRLQAAHLHGLHLGLGAQVGEAAFQAQLELRIFVLVAQLLVVELGQRRVGQRLVELQNGFARLHPRPHRHRHPPDGALNGAGNHGLPARNDGARRGQRSFDVAGFHGGRQDIVAAQAGLQHRAESQHARQGQRRQAGYQEPAAALSLVLGRSSNGSVHFRAGMRRVPALEAKGRAVFIIR